MSKYEISIIMPTYNSERTIENSLKSIRNQNYNQKKVEILVVDGGSTDRTLEIAKEYGCTVFVNEKKLPEFAKEIGFCEANGEWAIYLDSDEVFVNEDSFHKRMAFLKKYSKVKNLVSTGLICKKGETGINRYANYIGDPFSNYCYNKYNGYYRMESMKKNYPYKILDGGTAFSLKNAAFYPLYDAWGNMFHLETARRLYEEAEKQENFIANIFVNMVSTTKYVAMLEDDYVIHTPGMTAAVYKSKMIWRVKNNLFKSEGVGFASRVSKSKHLQKRRLQFILYSLSIILPLIDSIKLSIKNRDLYFMNHILWNEYVFCIIALYVVAKILNIPIKDNASYGK